MDRSCLMGTKLQSVWLNTIEVITYFPKKVESYHLKSYLLKKNVQILQSDQSKFYFNFSSGSLSRSDQHTCCEKPERVSRIQQNLESSLHRCCQYPIWVVVLVLVALFLIQLLVHGLGKQRRIAQGLGPLHQEKVSGFQLQISPSLAFVVIQGNELVAGCSLSVSAYLFSPSVRSNLKI